VPLRAARSHGSLETADAAGPIGRFRCCQGCRCSSRRLPRHRLRCRS
jgi:hypothetical protein